MQAAHRRHDISESDWELLEPHLPSREGTRGVTARDNRNFLNAVFWILRTGAPWRDLPPDYGDWKIPIAVFAGGEIVECGKYYLKFSCPNQILNGS